MATKKEPTPFMLAARELERTKAQLTKAERKVEEIQEQVAAQSRRVRELAGGESA